MLAGAGKLVMPVVLSAAAHTMQVSSFFVLYIIFIAFVGRSFVLLRPLGE
jgi:hypothetical protein